LGTEAGKRGCLSLSDLSGQAQRRIDFKQIGRNNRNESQKRKNGYRMKNYLLHHIFDLYLYLID